MDWMDRGKVRCIDSRYSRREVLQGSCGYTWIGSYCREVVDRHGLESTAGKDVV